jgi:glutamate--cysteine ligase
LSGAPHVDVAALDVELRTHLDELAGVGLDPNFYFLHLGFHPLAKPEDLPWVPKLRYPVMRRYLPTRGARGLDMMQRTATVQVNLDFESEDDAMRRLSLLLRVTPFLQAMTLNSPFIEGRLSPLLGERLDVWLNMDATRSGLIPELWGRSNPRYRDYAEWAVKAPMFLFMRGDVLHQNTGQTFEAFWRDGFEGERPTFADWKLHLGTLFPEVRLKTTLEVRGVDSQAPALALALPAFLAGLCYDDAASAAAWNLLVSLSLEEATRLRLEVREQGLRARWKGTPVQRTARRLVELASGGLARRSARGVSSSDESRYLAPLWDLLDRGLTPAEQVVDEHRKSGLELVQYLPRLARQGLEV